MFRTVFAAVFLAALSVTPAAAAPTLTERAILPADATAAAPFPGAPDTEPAPAPGARQPVGGFSALLDAPGRDTYFAMPDNGFGTQGQLALVPAAGLPRASALGPRRASREVLDWITLRDPRRPVPFELVNEDTAALLTGGDFDVESVRRDRRGDLWFGDEFGPFLLHTDARGIVLEAPIPLPGVSSPDYPAPTRGPEPRPLQRLRGHGDLARRADAVPDARGPAGRRRRQDDPADVHVRHRQAPLRGRPPRRTASPTPSHLVSDLTALDARRFVSLERDNLQGPAAEHKQAFVVDTRHGALTKRKVLDQLDIADPEGISLRGPVRPGDFGLGNPFRMPYQTIEAVLPVGSERARDRQRHELRLDGPQRVAAGLQRLHPRAGARAAGAPLASACSPSCHREKLISPHNCRELSSRRATWSSIRRVTAAGSK